ncbi:MAG: extracellular solute-binding protein [Acidimicrobiales bacterium]
MRPRRSALLLAVATVVPLAAACGSSTPSPAKATTTTASSSSSTGPTVAPKGHGKVAVLYAGSLIDLMEHHVGPAFDGATGYTFQGFAGGSKALAKEIKGKVRQGDVFLSASPKPNLDLEGKANGRWVSWYATFATSPLVIGYDPKSRFASQLETKPWWQVVTEPGFELGRTDPKLDPKGALTVEALDQAAAAHHDPALAELAKGTSGVFPETDLVGRLQAGQLDAGFFYSVEAAAVHPSLPTLSISPVHLAATYTITVLRGAPDRSGAVAFLGYLLGPGAEATLAAAGLHEMKPSLSGQSSDVPSGLRPVLPLSP